VRRTINMRNLFVLAGLASLLFCVACGSKRGSFGTTGTGGTGTGGFSKASLSGQYVYQIGGTDLNTGVPYREMGVFNANGSGAITSGTDNFAEGGNLTTTSTSGTYSIANDGTGTIILNGTAVGTITLAATLVSTSRVYLIEEDAANSAGVAEKQSSTTLPSATFAFKLHNVSNAGAGGGSSASVGVFTLSSGTVNGTADVNRSGVIDNGTSPPTPLTFTGSFNPPDSTGSGPGSFTDPTGTTNFLYSIVDANNIRLLSNFTGVVGLGRAEAQSGAPFMTDPLSGNSYAFGSRGDDGSATGGVGGVNTVGSFSASSGNIAPGAYDSVLDGTSRQNVSFTGSYTFSAAASNGRIPVTLNTAAPSTVQQVFWMVSPSRAFFLTTSDTSDPGKVEDGTADRQQGTFSNSTLSGQYAFVMDGFDLNFPLPLIDRVGWIQWNGSGGLTWNELANNEGALTQPGHLSGTYSVSSNGRATATVNTLSHANNDIVLYLVSGTPTNTNAPDAYILENDGGVEINGEMTHQ
jgi:hypothetical protein